MNYWTRDTLPKYLEREEIHDLLKVFNTRYLTSLRNKTIVSVMANCGLRVSEVVKLKPQDIDITRGKLRVMKSKRKKDRDIPYIPENTLGLLKAWKKRKPTSDYFFSTVRDNKSGGDHIKEVELKDGSKKEWSVKFDSKRGNQLSVRTIQSMIKKYAEKAGIPKDVTPHMLRHSYGTFYIKDGGNVETLQKLMGHSNINTTMIYVHLASIDTENGMRRFIEFT